MLRISLRKVQNLENYYDQSQEPSYNFLKSCVSRLKFGSVNHIQSKLISHFSSTYHRNIEVYQDKSWIVVYNIWKTLYSQNTNNRRRDVDVDFRNETDSAVDESVNAIGKHEENHMNVRRSDDQVVLITKVEFWTHIFMLENNWTLWKISR